MSAATTRITSAIHSGVLKLEALAARLADFTHDLHGRSLQDAYNAISVEAALLREQLTHLGQDTRDSTIAAKVVYATALKDAETAFNAEIARITDAHTAQRGFIVGKLDATNTAARSAFDAIDQHDEARLV